MKRSTKLVLRAVIAVPLGFVLVAWIANLFDKNNWPWFHTWGMVHGAILIALPLCIVVAFGLAWFLPVLLTFKSKEPVHRNIRNE